MSTALTARSADASTLPIIDVSRLADGDPAVRASEAGALRAACLGSGFFYISHHGVPAETIATMFDQARRFFDLPTPEKMALDVKTSPVLRGYSPLLSENTDLAGRGDLHESFDIGGVLYDGTDGGGFNRYPPALPTLRPAFEAYRAEMLRVAATLMRGFALALGLPADHFDGDLCRPQAFLRVLHYPPQTGEIDPSMIGIGAHTDYESLTILAQDENRALQLSDGQGGWLWADPIPGCFVVNIGDQMARWTNDLFKSTVHRAINVTGRRRYSIPFFYGPDPDTVIATLPGCAGPDRPEFYPPIRAGDYSEARLSASYGKAAAQPVG
jgi:isopenicillin N synthase-like dioxygenase